MLIDKKLLFAFEEGLVPHKPETSKIRAKVLGFGEISSIFQVGENGETAFKRMPLFRDKHPAEIYSRQYYEYCEFLREAGLKLPEHGTTIVAVPGRPVVLYIAQERFPADCFVHNILHTGKPDEIIDLVEQVVKEIEKVWDFNGKNRAGIELSLDAQLSNWVKKGSDLYYIDTSTPLFRKGGAEQMDPEPLLKSAPSFLRWILRLFFLEDVMNRYYDRRLVYIDLTANLYKEQRPDLIPQVIDIINNRLQGTIPPLTMKEIDKYYREDKLIWTLFLTFRRIDRWISTKLLRGRYEFILPGNVKR
jgi:hypothetical protein